MPKKQQNSPSHSPSNKRKTPAKKNSNSDEQDHDIQEEEQDSQEPDDRLIENDENYSADEDNDTPPVPNKSFNVKKKQDTSSAASPPSATSPPSSSKISFKCVSIVLIVIIALIVCLCSNSNPNSCSNDNDWRSKIDPHNRLSNHQQSMIRASLKPILDKCYTREEDVGVSTLLILSSNEESATNLARCLLKQVNTETSTNQISTEINLQSHSGGKRKLDSNLRTLLGTNDAIRAVLLRHIDKIPLNDELEQLRLLFAYCDGENPVIPHRLIIMTATSDSENENELREKFKLHWPDEHDFVDALMSRISGHTLSVEKDQISIC